MWIGLANFLVSLPLYVDLSTDIMTTEEAPSTTRDRVLHTFPGPQLLPG